MQDNKPYKTDYLNTESYVYSRLNDSTLTIYIPKALKGKVKVPQYVAAEYVEESDFRRVWEKL